VYRSEGFPLFSIIQVNESGGFLWRRLYRSGSGWDDQPTNQPERGLLLLVRGGSHLAISPFKGKLWLGMCLGDLKRGGGVTTAEGLRGLGKQAVHLHELYSGICL
jgi:hypothetical protein